MIAVVGIIIGLVLGLTGAGGSVFAVPLLVLAGLSLQDAVGLSLGAVAASAIFGSLMRLRSQQIVWLPAIIFASVGSIAAPAGNWLNRQLDERLLMAGFSLLVLIVAIRMWLQASASPDDTRVVRAGAGVKSNDSAALCRHTGGRFKVGVPCFFGMLGAALLTGFLSGLFGVGGGFLVVPMLILLTQISIHQAVATSLVIIACISTSGFISFSIWGPGLDAELLPLLVIGGLAGMAVGVFASRFLAGPTLQKIFAAALIAILAVSLVTSL